MIEIDKLPPYVKVGKYVSIAPPCHFHSLSIEHQWTINNKCVYTYNWFQPKEDGEIIIGNDVWIGEGCRILNGVTIGDGAIIGAGAVVSKDVPAYAVAVGNSARVVKYRFSKPIIKKLLKIKWWDWEKNFITTHLEDMLDVDKFIKKYG